MGPSDAIRFPPNQLRRKFKHARNFGIAAIAWTPQSEALFEQAIRAHVAAVATRTILGTYRGKPVTHFVNPRVV